MSNDQENINILDQPTQKQSDYGFIRDFLLSSDFDFNFNSSNGQPQHAFPHPSQSFNGSLKYRISLQVEMTTAPATMIRVRMS